jgi:hypothetical protein
MDAIDRLLEGSVDLHVHSSPSALPRRIDHVEAARSAESVGMRAIVVKCHQHSTAPDLIAMRRELDGCRTQVFGGVALNSHVGGLNPHAVDLCLAMGGKVVWFPTVSSRSHMQHAAMDRNTAKHFSAGLKLMPVAEVDIFDPDGDLLPEVHEIIRLVSDAGALLSSGHLAADQAIVLMRAAKDAGVEHMIVSHPEFVTGATDAQILELADMGVIIEHSLCMYDGVGSDPHYPVGELVRLIALVGPERTALGSDLGQVNEPLPIEGYRHVVGLLLEEGIPEQDLALMVRTNPARLIGLEA